VLEIKHKMRNQQKLTTTVLFAAACLAVHQQKNCADAFAPLSTTACRRPDNHAGSEWRMSSTENGNAETSANGASDGAAAGPGSFDDAAKAIRDAEDAEALARGSGMSEEEQAEFQSRATEFGSMKDRIRARAAEMNIEKSVATADAIKQRELRAKNMAAAPDPSLDMSVFEKRLLTQPEDELSDEEQAEIDPIGQLSFFEQALDELKNTAFPGPVEVLKTVGFMVVIGGFSSLVILKSDEFLRNLYVDWGFLPTPGQEIDYSKEFALPPDWEKDLNDLSGIFDAGTKALGIKAPEVPTINADIPTDL
jgi:hypothetical protein